MKDFIILIGIPASGKTTWANNWVNEDPSHRVRISISDLKKTLNSDNSVSSEIAGHLGYQLLQESVKKDLNIVIDDQNLDDAIIKLWYQALQSSGKEDQYTITKKVFHTSVDECIFRDKLRTDSIGEKEIRKTFRRYKDKLTLLANLEIVSKVPNFITNLPRCIIVDIDGTMCLNTTGRSFYNAGDEVLNDTPVVPVCRLIRAYIHEFNVTAIFITGRDRSMSEATKEFINVQLGIENPIVYYRNTTDFRKSYQTKLEVYQKYIRGKYNVDFVLEDNNSVVNMFREQGLTVLQPNASDY